VFFGVLYGCINHHPLLFHGQNKELIADTEIIKNRFRGYDDKIRICEQTFWQHFTIMFDGNNLD